jgi:Leucine-rich repeat (LRR) protein
LGNNQLKEIPPEIGELINLRTLQLRDNHLKKVPPEIGRMTNLQELNLSGNQLNEIPPEIGQLTNMKILHLNYNELKDIPEIGGLINLRKLYLEDQRTFISSELERLINIWTSINYIESNSESELEVVPLTGNYLCPVFCISESDLESESEE